jgi:phage-related protein
MTNLVEITIRTNDEATKALKGIKNSFEAAGTDAGKGFSGNFNKATGGGLLGELSGKGGGSTASDANRAGQQVGTGLARGMLQKFQTSLGSGLLSGLFGTSGGNKLFGSAGNTVTQDAAKQGNNIAQGFAKGLNNGFASVGGQLSGVMAGLFGNSGASERTVSDAKASGEDTAKGFSSGLRQGFSGVSSQIGSILGGLFGGAGSGPDVAAGEQSGKDAGKGFMSGFAANLSGSKVSSLLGGLFSSSSSGAAQKDGQAAGTSYGGGFTSALKSVLSKFRLPSFGGGGKGGGLAGAAASAGGSAASAGGNLAGGAMPGIAGLSGMQASIVGIGGALLAVIPAIVSVGSSLGVLGAGFMILEKTNKGFATDVQSTMTKIQGIFKSAVEPLAKPMEQAMSQIGGYLKGLEPEFKAVFAGVAPLIQPLLKGFEALVSGALPGFLSMIKGAKPVFATLAGAFGDLGKSLGSMFHDFAAAEGPSATVLKAILDLVNTIFPILGKLGEMFATALAPAVASFGKAIDGVLPVLIPVGKVLADLAGAVLGDLAGVLGSVGQLLKGLAPSFAILGKTLSSVFNTLENTGVFAILGDALESLAKPIAALINGLIKGLAPAFPVLIQAVGQLSTILIDALSSGLLTILKIATPLIAMLAGLIAKTIEWLSQNHLLIPILAAIAIAMNPIPALIIAIIAAVGFLGTHWQQIWTDIKNWTDDAVKFVTGLFHDLPSPLQTALKVIGDIWKAEFDVMEGVAKAVWDVIKAALKIAWDVISADFKVLLDLMTGNWKGAWNAVKAVGVQIWNAIKSALSGIWDDLKSTAGKVWDDMKSAVSDVWGEIKSLTEDAWKVVYNDILTPIKNAYNDVKSKIGDLQSAIKSIWDTIKSDAVAAWNATYNDIFTPIKNAYNDVKSKVGDLQGAIKGIWGTVKSDATAAWGLVYNDIINPVKNAYNWVTGKLGDLRSAMGTVWGHIQGEAKSGWGALEKIMGSPINFVINDVYMGGIRRLWDDVMGALGLGSLDLPSVSPISLSTGGRLAGFGGGDRNLALLEDGEAVVDKQRTQKYAPLLGAMGVPGFAAGGIVGDAGAVAKMTLAAATGNEVAFSNALSSIMPGGNGGAGGHWASVIATLPAKMIADMVKGTWKQIMGAGASSGGSGGTPGGGAPSANAALAKKMYPKWASGQNWTDWNNVAMRESGWSSTIQNAGSGALGIAQALGHGVSGGGGSLGNEYGGWGLSLAGDRNANSGQPGAQITWMANYMQQKYGGPIGAWQSELSIGSYDRGGWLPTGVSLAYNGTGRPEPVGAAAGGGPVQLEVSSAGASEFEQFMVTAIRKWVRTKGGGSVQTAFGR